MTNPQKSAREWTLNFFYGACKVIAANEQFILNEEQIHVIEYSAYEQAVRERDALSTDCGKLELANLQLIKERDLYKAGLEEITKTETSMFMREIARQALKADEGE